MVPKCPQKGVIPLDWFPISGHTTNCLAIWLAGSLEHGQANFGTAGHLQSFNKPSAAECHFWTTGQQVPKLPGPLWPAWACQLSEGTLGMADS